MKGNYLKEVRDQYEDYPYPYRDPKDEKKRLLITVTDSLPMINHYVYGGKQTFRNFEVLVAGGGTGDSTIYLAEQLRGIPDAKVTYVDLSSASMEIARARAKDRKLFNIEWHQMSLLDVGQLEKKFDFINCTGVLHHLASPEAGLRALESVMKPDGAMALMVYGHYGRAAIYQMQELLKRINDRDMSAAQKVGIAKKVLPLLPQSNLFRMQARWMNELGRNGDIGLYDLLLHSTDRAYTVPQLYDWLATASLTITRFCCDIGQHLRYMPESVFGRDASLLAHIKSLPLPRQQAIAEVAHSNMIKHAFFATRGKKEAATPKDEDMVPCFFMNVVDGATISKRLNASAGEGIQVDIGREVKVSIKAERFTADIFRQIDGQRTIGKIFDEVQAKHKEAKREEIRMAFDRIYTQFELVDALVLRHKSVPEFPSLTAMQQRVAKKKGR
ncbi:MAG: methyltransferase domain-containing protein [Proteobacteria bacterium]|nr:methyltransferase domain-containing protein [Pseudomonadota bacterium]